MGDVRPEDAQEVAARCLDEDSQSFLEAGASRDKNFFLLIKFHPNANTSHTYLSYCPKLGLKIKKIMGCAILQVLEASSRIGGRVKPSQHQCLLNVAANGELKLTLISKLVNKWLDLFSIE